MIEAAIRCLKHMGKYYLTLRKKDLHVTIKEE